MGNFVQGAEYEVEDSEAWTPLHCAAKGGYAHHLETIVLFHKSTQTIAQN